MAIVQNQSVFFTDCLLVSLVLVFKDRSSVQESGVSELIDKFVSKEIQEQFLQDDAFHKITSEIQKTISKGLLSTNR